MHELTRRKLAVKTSLGHRVTPDRPLALGARVTTTRKRASRPARDDRFQVPDADDDPDAPRRSSGSAIGCSGSRWRRRFGKDRGHRPEAVDAHRHSANRRDVSCRTELMTESATERIGCWSARGELPGSLRHTAVAEVRVRAGDHVAHVDLRTPATVAVHCGHESPPIDSLELTALWCVAPHDSHSIASEPNRACSAPSNLPWAHGIQ